METKGITPFKSTDRPMMMKVRCSRFVSKDVGICNQVYLRIVGNEQAVEFPRDKSARDRCPKCGCAEWHYMTELKPRNYTERYYTGEKKTVETPVVEIRSNYGEWER